MPWMVGCGNHDCLSKDDPHKIAWKGAVIDAGTDGGQCGVPYDARFRMPGDPSAIAGWAQARGGTRNNLFYGFDLGLVHLVMVSSEHDLTAGSLQRTWLDAHLGAVDRQRTPFVILGLHRPLYTSTQSGQKAPETAGLRDALEPLLLAHRVTAVTAGHYHQYERSCAVAAAACVDVGAANATVHVTAGIAGVTHDDDWIADTPAWVAKQSRGVFGYLRFDVVNRTHLRAAAIDARDDSSFDEFWLRA